MRRILGILLAAGAVGPGMAQDFRLPPAAEQGSLVRGSAPKGSVRLSLDGRPIPMAADGQFIFGLDRDAGSAVTLTAQLGDGRAIAKRIDVLKRRWPVQHVNVARRPSADPDYLRRRATELERIGASRAVDTKSQGWRQTFLLPAAGRFSGVFGSQRIYRGEPGAFHSGLDMAAGAGAPVRAPADGVVVLAGPPSFSLEGNLVIVDHGMGLNSAFLHLSQVAVRQGQTLRQGDLIGRVGATGRVTGPHLHWSVKWHDARIDPQKLLGGAR